MTAERPTVAITGASGYMGGVIRFALKAGGWRTIALVRSPPPWDDDSIPFMLGRPLDPAILEGVDAMVHCAYDPRLTDRRSIWRVNVAGTEGLLEAAGRADVPRCLVISSTAAYPGTRQLYGQAKLATEEIAAKHGAMTVRPGLVYGPHPGGIVGSLARAVSLPVVPLLAERSYLYTLHQDDLATAVSTLLATDDPPGGPFVLSHPRPVPMGVLVRTLAAVQGKHPTFVPLPWRPVYWALRLAELLPVTLPFRADSLWGLAHPTPGPDPAVVDALGLHPRPFSPEGLAPTPA